MRLQPPFYARDCTEMYERILHDKLRFPAHVTETARSIISELLVRDPKKRLGAGKDDAAEIMRHPFFESIDWVKLYNKEYKPPYTPSVVRSFSRSGNFSHRRGQNGAMDLRNFDPQFLNEPIPASLLDENRFMVDIEIDDTFSGFSYTADDAFEEMSSGFS